MHAAVLPLKMQEEPQAKPGRQPLHGGKGRNMYSLESERNAFCQHLDVETHFRLWMPELEKTWVLGHGISYL